MTKTKKDNHNTFFPICNYHLGIFRCVYISGIARKNWKVKKDHGEQVTGAMKGDMGEGVVLIGKGI